ncbi:MAG: HesA/MoeB/ThiF family protein [Opitutaceae bacterium]|nr:HesA/MoeB/ThiF family protein [Cytophagales bacterium]
MLLSKPEQERYQRHIILPGFGLAAQEKLKSSSILVIGAGGLGCPALLYLVSCGFGRIGILDDDHVSESNLHRQVLYSSSDIGLSKAIVAKEKLSSINPFVQIEAFQTHINSTNALDLIRGFDIVMDGSDNFSTRYLVNDACVILGKPLVSGSIFTFEGQVSVFNYQNGPTYRCLFPQPPSASEMPNCSEIGVLGVLPGVVGTIMATEAIKVATNIGEILSGKLLVYNALNMDFHKLSFELVPENRLIQTLSDLPLECSILTEISSAEMKKMIVGKEDFQLIDVREKEEFDAFNIGGENFPLTQIQSFIPQISRDKKVVFHCKSGGRSKKAIEILERDYSFTNLINLKNGLSDW